MSKKIKLLYSVSIITLISYIVFLSYKYNSIPNNIVIHRYGEKLSYGNKMVLFLPVIFNVCILILVWLVIKYPKKMITLSDTADEKSYERMQFIIVLISAIATIICTYLLFSDVIYN